MTRNDDRNLFRALSGERLVLDRTKINGNDWMAVTIPIKRVGIQYPSVWYTVLHDCYHKSSITAPLWKITINDTIITPLEKRTCYCGEKIPEEITFTLMMDYALEGMS